MMHANFATLQTMLTIYTHANLLQMQVSRIISEKKLDHHEKFHEMISVNFTLLSGIIRVERIGVVKFA